MAHYVTGIFDDPETAERAVQTLIDGHFNPEEISILVADQEGFHREKPRWDTRIAEGAVTGASLGGLLGALGTTLVATGVVALPGPGAALLGTGPVVAALSGALGGGAVGLEFGALAGMGFWEDEAEIHASALERGGILVVVPADHEHVEDARRAFSAAGASAVRG